MTLPISINDRFHGGWFIRGPRRNLQNGKVGCRAAPWPRSHISSVFDRADSEAGCSADRKAHQRRAFLAKSQSQSRRPITAPATCAGRKSSALAGAMPANVSEKIRAIVTAGFAKDVEAVNQ